MSCRILAVMDLVTVPKWAAPTDRQVIDAHQLAVIYAQRRGSWRDLGRAEAFAWATFGGDAPEGDLAAAGPPAHGPVLQVLRAATAGARPSTGRTVDTREWATGVAEALAWLVTGGGTPGIGLPVRRADGELAGVDDLYRPDPQWEPEQRHAAWDLAVRTATRSRHLAELAASV